ncbi:MAG: pyridoxal phosphate-dependent aminotransferase [Bacteroidales bacterium]|nr:pyridoxal phosphate-dependent aminotransferase [Candidatus Colimorpha onthohippi]
MKYDFDEIFNRKGSDCVKYDRLEAIFGTADVDPMWVADMDFRSPEVILDAIRHRLDHGVLGYTYATSHYFEAVRNWMKRRYAIEASDSELHFIPGIVAGISFALQVFTQPSDAILLLAPVYPPFINLPSGSQRKVHYSKLHRKEGRFVIDFDDLDRKARGCKMMILANPHNPGGTVWSQTELSQIAEICNRHGLVVVADEIHADLTLPGYHHVAYPTVSPLAAAQCLMFFAPSKTFNIAGLSSSVCYIPNEELRQCFYAYLDTFELANGNIFAFVGAEAAYRYGEPWLEECVRYLAGNVAALDEFLQSQMPRVKAVLPQASYLAWLDFADYGYQHAESRSRLLYRAKVALNSGTNFGGSDFENCFRLNIGCPRLKMMEALTRIKEAFDE